MSKELPLVCSKIEGQDKHRGEISTFYLTWTVAMDELTGDMLAVAIYTYELVIGIMDEAYVVIAEH